MPLTESAVLEAYAICEVDDACRPALNQIGVEVELANAPKLRSEVKGKPMVFVMVTAPVAPETEMPLPATLEVTPVLVMVSPEPMIDWPAVTERPVEPVIVPVATDATAVPPAPP